MNPSFESLEHFHVEFSLDDCTMWYKLMADEPPHNEEHNGHGFDFWFAYSGLLGAKGRRWYFAVSRSYSNPQDLSPMMALSK